MYHRLIMLCLFGFLSSVYAKSDINKLAIEQGSIVYEVSGSTQFSPEINLSIEGEIILHFKEWGNTKVEEENGLLFMDGTFEYRQKVNNFIKYSGDKMITVDYDNQQLIIGKRTSEKLQDNATENLDMVGKKMIAGFECEVWKGASVEKCIYKGLVLSIESRVYNTHYLKVATSVVLDENMTDEDFTLPDYPVHKIGLLNKYQKNKKLQKSNCFTKAVKKEHSYEDNKTNFLIHLGEDIFNQQKKLLPKLLLLMKKTRESLQSVENPFEDTDCLERFSEMNRYNGSDKEEYTLLWDEENTQTLLNRLEDDLLSLQSKIPCVKRAKNILDLSLCMKDK